MDKLPESLVKRLDDETDRALEMIDRKDDIRLIIARFSQINTVGWIISETYDDPDTRFVSFILNQVKNSLQTAYAEGRDEEWYKLNQKSISEILPPFRKYIESLKTDLANFDFAKIVDSSKNFFYAAYKNIRLLS